MGTYWKNALDLHSTGKVWWPSNGLFPRQRVVCEEQISLTSPSYPLWVSVQESRQVWQAQVSWQGWLLRQVWGSSKADCWQVSCCNLSSGLTNFHMTNHWVASHIGQKSESGLVPPCTASIAC